MSSSLIFTNNNVALTTALMHTRTHSLTRSLTFNSSSESLCLKKKGNVGCCRRVKDSMRSDNNLKRQRTQYLYFINSRCGFVSCLCRRVCARVYAATNVNCVQKIMCDETNAKMMIRLMIGNFQSIFAQFFTIDTLLLLSVCFELGVPLVRCHQWVRADKNVCLSLAVDPKQTLLPLTLLP